MATPTATRKPQNVVERYECGPFRFADNDYYDRHLVFDHVVPMEKASKRQRYEAVACAVRDLLTQRWLLTQKTHEERNCKQVYYLSMEFLIGRTLANTIENLQVEEFVREAERAAFVALDDILGLARCSWSWSCHGSITLSANKVQDLT